LPNEDAALRFAIDSSDAEVAMKRLREMHTESREAERRARDLQQASERMAPTLRTEADLHRANADRIKLLADELQRATRRQQDFAEAVQRLTPALSAELDVQRQREQQMRSTGDQIGRLIEQHSKLIEVTGRMSSAVQGEIDVQRRVQEQIGVTGSRVDELTERLKKMRETWADSGRGFTSQSFDQTVRDLGQISAAFQQTAVGFEAFNRAVRAAGVNADEGMSALQRIRMGISGVGSESDRVRASLSGIGVSTAGRGGDDADRVLQDLLQRVRSSSNPTALAPLLQDALGPLSQQSLAGLMQPERRTAWDINRAQALGDRERQAAFMQQQTGERRVAGERFDSSQTDRLADLRSQFSYNAPGDRFREMFETTTQSIARYEGYGRDRSRTPFAETAEGKRRAEREAMEDYRSSGLYAARIADARQTYDERVRGGYGVGSQYQRPFGASLDWLPFGLGDRINAAADYYTDAYRMGRTREEPEDPRDPQRRSARNLNTIPDEFARARVAASQSEMASFSRYTFNADGESFFAVTPPRTDEEATRAVQGMVETRRTPEERQIDTIVREEMERLRIPASVQQGFAGMGHRDILQRLRPVGAIPGGGQFELSADQARAIQAAISNYTLPRRAETAGKVEDESLYYRRGTAAAGAALADPFSTAPDVLGVAMGAQFGELARVGGGEAQTPAQRFRLMLDQGEYNETLASGTRREGRRIDTERRFERAAFAGGDAGAAERMRRLDVERELMREIAAARQLAATGDTSGLDRVGRLVDGRMTEGTLTARVQVSRNREDLGEALSRSSVEFGRLSGMSLGERSSEERRLAAAESILSREDDAFRLETMPERRRAIARSRLESDQDLSRQVTVRMGLEDYGRQEDTRLRAAAEVGTMDAGTRAGLDALADPAARGSAGTFAAMRAQASAMLERDPSAQSFNDQLRLMVSRAGDRGVQGLATQREVRRLDTEDAAALRQYGGGDAEAQQRLRRLEAERDLVREIAAARELANQGDSGAVRNVERLVAARTEEARVADQSRQDQFRAILVAGTQSTSRELDALRGLSPGDRSLAERRIGAAVNQLSAEDRQFAKLTPEEQRSQARSRLGSDASLAGAVDQRLATSDQERRDRTEAAYQLQLTSLGTGRSGVPWLDREARLSVELERLRLNEPDPEMRRRGETLARFGAEADADAQVNTWRFQQGMEGWRSRSRSNFILRGQMPGPPSVSNFEPTPLAGSGAGMRQDIRERITTEAQRRGLDPGLALAVARTESGGTHLTRNRAGELEVLRGTSGEYGVFQVMPNHATSRGLPASRLEDLDTNISFGLDYWGEAMRVSHNNPIAAYAYYNAGPAGSRAFREAGGTIDQLGLLSPTAQRNMRERFLPNLQATRVASTGEAPAPSGNEPQPRPPVASRVVVPPAAGAGPTINFRDLDRVRSTLYGGIPIADAAVAAGEAAAMAGRPGEAGAMTGQAIEGRVEQAIEQMSQAALRAADALGNLRDRGTAAALGGYAAERQQIEQQLRPSEYLSRALEARLPPGDPRRATLSGLRDTNRGLAMSALEETRGIRMSRSDAALDDSLSDQRFAAENFFLSRSSLSTEFAVRQESRRLFRDEGIGADDPRHDERIGRIRENARLTGMNEEVQEIRSAFQGLGQMAGQALDGITVRGGDARRTLQGLLAELASFAVRRTTSKVAELAFEWGGKAITSLIGGGASSYGDADVNFPLGGRETPIEMGARGMIVEAYAAGGDAGGTAILPLTSTTGGQRAIRRVRGAEAVPTDRIIEQPTSFAMGKGRRGLAAEAGPEAAMRIVRMADGTPAVQGRQNGRPVLLELARGPSGELGVRGDGEGPALPVGRGPDGGLEIEVPHMRGGIVGSSPERAERLAALPSMLPSGGGGGQGGAAPIVIQQSLSYHLGSGGRSGQAGRNVGEEDDGMDEQKMRAFAREAAMLQRQQSEALIQEHMRTGGFFNQLYPR
jgi:hypothetical protein